MYCSAFARSYLNEFVKAQNHADRQSCLHRCLILGKLILNVMEPMATDLYGKPVAKQFHELASTLLRLTAHDSELNFPPDDGRQLLIDRMEEVQLELKATRQCLQNTRHFLNEKFDSLDILQSAIRQEAERSAA